MLNLSRLLPILLPLLLAACGSKSNDSASPTLQSDAPITDTACVRLALMPTADCLPFYYAQRTGIYRQLGLKVNIRTYAGQLDLDTALCGTSADAGYADAERLAQPHMKRAPLRIAGTGTDSWQLYADGALRMKDVKALNGRLVAIARESSERAWFTQLVGSVGLRTEQVFTPFVNDVQLRAQMLANRQVDAAMLRWPYSVSAKTEGARLMATQPTKASAARFVTCSGKGSRISDSRLQLLRKGYAMALDSLRHASRSRLTPILQHDYALPAPIADTINIPRGGFSFK